MVYDMACLILGILIGFFICAFSVWMISESFFYYEDENVADFDTSEGEDWA